MEFSRIRPDLVKYEMRMVSGDNPFEQERKTPGAFGRFLSGMGRFFSAIAAPMSLIFPPAAIGAAGMYGIGQIGDQMQFRAYQKMMQQQGGAQSISYPGLDLSETGNYTPLSGEGYSLSGQQENAMGVLFARNDMMLDSAHRI